MRVQILSGLLFSESILCAIRDASRAEQVIFRVARLEPPGTDTAPARWIHRLGVWKLLADSYTEAFLRSWGILWGNLKGPLTFWKAVCYFSSHDSCQAVRESFHTFPRLSSQQLDEASSFQTSSSLAVCLVPTTVHILQPTTTYHSQLCLFPVSAKYSECVKHKINLSVPLLPFSTVLPG